VRNPGTSATDLTLVRLGVWVHKAKLLFLHLLSPVCGNDMLGNR
jgi:hypothetical protein